MRGEDGVEGRDDDAIRVKAKFSGPVPSVKYSRKGDVVEGDAWAEDEASLND